MKTETHHLSGVWQLQGVKLYTSVPPVPHHPTLMQFPLPSIREYGTNYPLHWAVRG